MRAHNKKAVTVYVILTCLVGILLVSCRATGPKPPKSPQIEQNKLTEVKENKPSKNNKNEIAVKGEDKEVKKKSNKEVYLTFDDGPTNNTTREILNILQENDIKATFFVIGNIAENNPKLLRELSDNNMCVVPHTYSHRYNEIFSSPKNYIEDLDRCTDLIRNITGKEVVPYMRIPGGMENRYVSRETMSKITTILRSKNINYVGWNICTNDAVGRSISAEQIKDNLINQSKKLQNNKALVVLMHDSYHKKSTVEALPFIINYYKSQGYEFETFNNISKETYDKLVSNNVMNKDINKANIK